MSGFNESVNTINSFIRTLLAIAVLGGIVAGCWLGYNLIFAEDIEAKRAEEALAKKERELTDAQQRLKSFQAKLSSAETTLQEQEAKIQQKEQLLRDKDVELGEHKATIKDQETTIADQLEDIRELDEENQRLATSVRLLKFNHRLAQVTVLSVTTDPGTGRPVSEIEFVEINNNGDKIERPRVFPIDGDLVYIDNWVVKFDDKYIERAEDLDRSTSLCLFRRIFGEFQNPSDGFQLDETNSRPLSYARGGQISELEERIWNDFWEIANDRELSDELGIRAAHGEAVSFKAVEGKKYVLQLRASDGLTLQTTEEAGLPKPPT